MRINEIEGFAQGVFTPAAYKRGVAELRCTPDKVLRTGPPWISFSWSAFTREKSPPPGRDDGPYRKGVKRLVGCGALSDRRMIYLIAPAVYGHGAPLAPLTSRRPHTPSMVAAASCPTKEARRHC